MNIAIFNRRYWVRRFEEQREVRGYMVSGHADFVAELHLHPGTDQVDMKDEGGRRLARLEGHGNVQLVTATQNVSHKGDLVRYRGTWFECIRVLLYDHTVLNHWNYSFVEVPEEEIRNPARFRELAPPLSEEPTKEEQAQHSAPGSITDGQDRPGELTWTWQPLPEETAGKDEPSWTWQPFPEETDRGRSRRR